MKKFNVKVLSMAVAAAVVSGAAAAEEVNFAQAVGGKPDQGQAAFFTVFGEGTTYDKGTGKLTFKKDSDALLLKTLELEQTINGFASGSNFITTDANGNKTVREATNEDIEADSLKGVGLAGGLTAVNARVDDLLDDTAAALDEQEKAIEKLNNATKTNIDQITKITEGVNTLNTSVAEMGKDISTKFDEVDSEISKASSELSESIEKVSEDVTAVNTRVDSLAQDAADAKANAKAAEDKVTALSANVDSKIKEAKDASDKAVDAADKAKDAADKAVDAASKIDTVAEKADKASKGVEVLAKSLEAVTEQTALSIAENTQKFDGFKEGDEIVFTDDKGIKSIKTADKADVEADEFQGLGLKKAVKNTQKATAQATLAAIENDQELNGFKEGDQIVVTKEDGSKVIRTAKKEDVEADGFGGKGLKEVVAAHDETLDGLTKSVTDNKALLEAQGEANEGFNNAIASLDEDVDALKKADLTTAEALEAHKTALEANRKDIDANKALLAEQGEANEGFNNAIASLDEDVDALKKADLTTAEALEAHKTALEANRKDIDANKALLAEQGEANEGFNNAIASLGEDISTLKKAGLAAADALEVNRTDIDANKVAIVENARALNGFKEGDEIVFTDDKGIKSIKTADKADVEADEFQGLGLKKAVKNTQKATAQATLAAIENDQELNGFKEGDQIVVTKEDGSKVIRTAKKEDVEADGFGGKGLKEVVAAHDEALGDLTETVNDNSEALVKTAEVVNAISADVTANKEAIKNKADQTAVESVRTIAVEAKESVQAVQGSVEAARQSAEIAERHAKAAQTSADTANNVASAAQTTAAQAQDAVKANTAQVAANKADIATLQTASNQHAAGIAKNSARIDSLDKNVANLRKETRQGLAAQAALSGLFQPYSVGKFNVTAALGGFKSDTAVAVGAGYRFNENFAAKAGLAVGTSSGGSASYNVGVNYEW